jgi:gluconolactonase
MSQKLETEVVKDGLGFPEGPVAMADGSLLFVDIKDQTLLRLGTDGKIDVVAEIPGGPNGVAIGPDGAAYVCNNGGVYRFEANGPGGSTIPNPNPGGFRGGSIQRVDLKTGQVTDLYWHHEGKSLLAPDDIVFDKSGGFWFTETGIQDEETTRNGAVYYATIDGKFLQRVVTIPMPNGIGLSPDGKTVYVSDTIFGRLWALDIIEPDKDAPLPVKVKPGLLPVMPGRVIQTLPTFQWLGSLPAIQWLDSLKVEEGGKVCVGTIFNGGITVFSPDDGTTEHYVVDDLFTTNLCFGGDDMMDVWITASSTGRILKARWKRPGLKLAHQQLGWT